jgi:hypothetical protein
MFKHITAFFINTRKYPHESGQAIIISILFFLFGSMVVGTGILLPISRDTRAVNDFTVSKQSMALAEGSADEVAYRAKSGLTYGSSESLSEGAVSVTTTVTDTLDGKEVVATGNTANRIRKVKLLLLEGAGAAFNYGVQVGLGGFVLNNSASIEGNIYSAGSILVTSTGSITGDAISAGSGGLIDGATVGGDAYANIITDSTVTGDCYYDTNISGSTCASYTSGSADQPILGLPIEDTLVEDWKTDAALGGTISSPCPYKITTSATLGPVKIDCDLEISSTAVVTLLGNVWVNGDIEIRNSATINADSSIGNKSVVIVADETLNPTTGGIIDLENSATFNGNGQPRSYILLLSQNTSAEEGGGVTAIDLKNTVSGDYIIYAGHGKIEISNNSTLAEVVAYLVEVNNAATVIYESGLSNLIFTSGPSGGFSIEEWGETQ